MPLFHCGSIPWITDRCRLHILHECSVPGSRPPTLSVNMKIGSTCKLCFFFRVLEGQMMYKVLCPIIGQCTQTFFFCVYIIRFIPFISPKQYSGCLSIICPTAAPTAFATPACSAYRYACRSLGTHPAAIRGAGAPAPTSIRMFAFPTYPHLPGSDLASFSNDFPRSFVPPAMRDAPALPPLSCKYLDTPNRADDSPYVIRRSHAVYLSVSIRIFQSHPGPLQSGTTRRGPDLYRTVWSSPDLTVNTARTYRSCAFTLVLHPARQVPPQRLLHCPFCRQAMSVVVPPIYRQPGNPGSRSIW